MDTSRQGGRTAVPRDSGRAEWENPRSAEEEVRPRKVAWFEERREWGLRKDSELIERAGSERGLAPKTRSSQPLASSLCGSRYGQRVNRTAKSEPPGEKSSEGNQGQRNVLKGGGSRAVKQRRTAIDRVERMLRSAGRKEGDEATLPP